MDEREIERLVETHLVTDLEKAEQALIAGRKVKISLPGANPGEKLASVAAAKWIVERIKLDGCDFKTAYQAYQEVIKEN